MIHDSLYWLLFIPQIGILLYFFSLNGIYILLNLLSLGDIRRIMARRSIQTEAVIHTGHEPPISILVPAYNESATIRTSIRAMMQLQYPEFEIIIVNDGSTDDTLQHLIEEFHLVKFPGAYRARLKTSPIRGMYRSKLYPDLQVIDKQNGGGKADAVNAGINAARLPLILITDADSILQRDALLRAVQPFLESPRTVGCGGTIRVANGCVAHGGVLTKVGLPSSWLARFQIVEYFRSFLFGRVGWSRIDALMILSGAFGLFHKDTVLEAGGYRTDTKGEDIELTVRLHDRLLKKGAPYRLHHVLDPICWTDVPENLRTLGRQRIRWQIGLSETLWAHRGLLFRKGSGAPGWVALPFFLVFEWAGPLIEAFGYLLFVVGFAFGIIGPHSFLLFLGVAIGMGVLLSTSAVLLEEISFHAYPRKRDLAILLVAGVLENFGYRQIHTYWRLVGILQWLRRKETKWGAMERSRGWAQAA